MYVFQLNKKIRQTVLFTAVMICFQFSLTAQDSPKDGFVISAPAHYGFIISHHGNMADLVKGHIFGGELDYIFRTTGKKSWQSLYKFPEFGVAALHLYLANPSELGNLDALYSYTNLRLNKENRHFRLDLRLGAGFAYISKPYDRITNHKNNAIGSHYNGFVNLRLTSSYMLSPAWRLDAGVGLSHASNGAFKTPNLGLNMATVDLGVGYVFGNKTLDMKTDSALSPAKKQWHPSVIAVAGLKELEHPDGSKYAAYGLILNMYHTRNYKNKFGGGLELAYNNATREAYYKDTIHSGKEKTKDILQAGVKVGYSFVLDRLSFPIEFGYYFYKQDGNTDRIFNRIGLRYLVTKHVILNITLLTHFAKADYFEWGAGYEF